MFEVSTASSNTSLQLLCEVFHSFVDRSLWQVAPDNLNCLLEFGDCLRLYFKLAVSLQHCTLHVIVNWVCIRRILWPLVFVMKSGQLAHSQFCALRAVCAGTQSCWKMKPVGSRRLLWKNDNLVIIYKQNKLVLSKRHCDVIGSNVVTGFWKLNSIFSLNVFNAEKSIGGRVQKPIILSFFNRIMSLGS